MQTTIIQSVTVLNSLANLWIPAFYFQSKIWSSFVDTSKFEKNAPIKVFWLIEIDIHSFKMGWDRFIHSFKMGRAPSGCETGVTLVFPFTGSGCLQWLSKISTLLSGCVHIVMFGWGFSSEGWRRQKYEKFSAQNADGRTLTSTMVGNYSIVDKHSMSTVIQGRKNI